jgi:hypothetical protein
MPRGRGRPKKEGVVKEEETCVSLNFPQRTTCCHCIRGKPEHCEKAWAKDNPKTYEELHQYFDAWIMLSGDGYLFPDRFHVIKKRKKWKAYIMAYVELSKECTSKKRPYQSLSNPDSTPTKKLSSVSARLKSSVKTPIDRLKCMIKRTKLSLLPSPSKALSPSSESSSPSTPEPVSPTSTGALDRTPVKTPTQKKLFEDHKEYPVEPPPELAIDVSSNTLGNNTSSLFDQYQHHYTTLQHSQAQLNYQPQSQLLSQGYNPAAPPPELAIDVTSSRHPQLNTLGITSSTNTGLFKKLIAEVNDFGKVNDIPLNFNHFGNHRLGLLSCIPRCSTKESFVIVQHQTKWLDKIMSHVGAGSDETAAEWIMGYLANAYEEQFYKIANEMGLHYGKKKMCPVATSAMIAEAHITTRQSKIMFRHMRNYFGRSMTVSTEKVLNETNGYKEILSEPTYWDYDDYDKEDTKGKKKPKKVKIWVSDAMETMSYDMRLVVEAKMQELYDTLQASDGEQGSPKWGYLLDDGKNGINIVIGQDQGQGSSQLLAKMNLLAASEIKKTGKIEDGSRVIQYGCIECKKDTEPILREVAPALEKTISQLEEGMLMGVEDEEKNIDVVCIPKAFKDTVWSRVRGNKVELAWLCEEGTRSIECKNLKGIGVRWWSVIDNFYYSVAGDIAYFMTIQGRGPSTTSRCPYCDLKASQWKRSKKKGNLLTLVILREMQEKWFKYVKDCEEAKASGKVPPPKPDTLGVTGEIHCSADPARFTLPILHLLIGLLNKALEDFRLWLDVHVEFIGKEEMALRKKYATTLQKHEVITERMQDIGFEKQDLYHHKKELEEALEEGKDDHKLQELNRTKQHIKDLINEWKDLKERKKPLSQMKTQLKTEMDKATKDRIGDDDGLKTVFDASMKLRARIVASAYHGGSLNGVDCKRFLNELEYIMSDIKKESEERLKKSQEKYDVVTTSDDLRSKLETFTQLMLTMDCVFSLLRTPAPTDKDREDLEDSIKVFRALWEKLEINVTVKAHILFDHAMDHFSKEGGISDRVEDFIEKHHQTISGLDHLAATLPSGCFKQQQELIMKRLFQKSHPKIQKQVKKVNEDAKRNFKDERRETAEENNKQRRIERRNETKTAAFYNNIVNS